MPLHLELPSRKDTRSSISGNERSCWGVFGGLLEPSAPAGFEQVTSSSCWGVFGGSAEHSSHFADRSEGLGRNRDAFESSGDDGRSGRTAGDLPV